MHVQTFKQVRVLLIACLISAGAAVVSLPTTAQLTTATTGESQQNTIRFACPDFLLLAAQTSEGWTYPWGIKKLKFKSAAAFGGNINCSYGDSFGDTLTRPIPKGYECNDDGGRNIECKRIKPPIKVPGK